jgi:predicted DNA-binding protein
MEIAMSTTVELPDEIYVRLESQAKVRGLTITQVISQFVEAAEKVRIAAAIERLRTKGLLLVPTEPVPPLATHVKPLHVQGQPLSEAIIEERR